MQLTPLHTTELKPCIKATEHLQPFASARCSTAQQRATAILLIEAVHWLGSALIVSNASTHFTHGPSLRLLLMLSEALRLVVAVGLLLLLAQELGHHRREGHGGREAHGGQRLVGGVGDGERAHLYSSKDDEWLFYVRLARQQCLQAAQYPP